MPKIDRETADRIEALVIRCYRNSVLQMTGRGSEYLLDEQGNVLAKFWDGQMVVTTISVGNTEKTVEAA